MNRDKPKQAFAARDAHQALLVLKELVDDATKTIHAAELAPFYLAINQAENKSVRRTLQNVVESLKSSDFDAVLSQVRDELETAALI